MKTQMPLDTRIEILKFHELQQRVLEVRRILHFKQRIRHFPVVEPDHVYGFCLPCDVVVAEGVDLVHRGEISQVSREE